MAATIKIKNSSTASAVPTSSDLVQGELAVNVTDKRIFTENASGTVVELGTNPSSITLPAGSASAPTLLASGDTNTGLFFPAADTVGVTTGGTERVRVDSSGNVGIGVSPTTLTAAANSLQVYGGASQGRIAVQNSTTGSTATSGFHLCAIGSRAILDQRSASSLEFTTDATERMRIDSSGNICFGTTVPIIAGYQTNSYNGASFRGLVLNDTSSTSGGTFAGFAIAGTQIGSITRVAATSAVAFNTTSDQRLKSNIQDATPVLDKLMEVKVRQYDWTEGDLHQDYGFVAQELEPILSGIVTKGKEDKDMWQLDYSRLTPHLLKAIQEQQAIITSLTARIEALEQA